METEQIRWKTHEKRNVEGSNQAENIEDQSIPTPYNTKHGFVGKFCFEMALDFPCVPESDMCKTYNCPDEEE